MARNDIMVYGTRIWSRLLAAHVHEQVVPNGKSSFDRSLIAKTFSCMHRLTHLLFHLRIPPFGTWKKIKDADEENGVVTLMMTSFTILYEIKFSFPPFDHRDN